MMVVQAVVPVETAAGIRRSVLRLAVRLRSARSAGALTDSKLNVLGYLHRHGPSPAGVLAAAHRQQPQTLTRVLTQLEQDGLFSRSRDADDGRRSIIGLTAAGEGALAADMATSGGLRAAAIARLNATEREVLRLAADLMDQLADTEEIT